MIANSQPADARSFMPKDRFEQPVSTDSERAAQLNDQANDCLFALQPGGGELIDAALELDPHFALAHCTKARALLQSGQTAAAREFAKRGQQLAEHLSKREQQHAGIVCQAIHGQSAAALQALRDHAAEHPRDAVPLSFALGVYGLLGFGGLTDFQTQQVRLLESVAPAWGEDWWFLAAFGWATVEIGRTREGIAMLDRALALNPANANAVHGRAHGYYEEGAVAEGEAFIAAWLPGYSRAALLHGHLAWHQALFALQRGAVERALDVYRASICPQASAALPMFTTIDCVSLLMRLLLCGCPPTAEQRRELAAYVDAHFAKPGMPFLNVHLALAHGCAGDDSALAELSERMASLPTAGQSGAVARRLCAAIADYAEGRFGEAAAILDEVAPRLTAIGGSNAQRDLFIDLNAAAHLCAGAEPKARAVVQDRSSRRAGHLNEAWFEHSIRHAGAVRPGA